MNESIVITGGHTGIGGECCRRLVAAGAHVVVASRDVDRAQTPGSKWSARRSAPPTASSAPSA